MHHLHVLAGTVIIHASEYRDVSLHIAPSIHV